MLAADRGYDGDWIRELAMKNGAWTNIPPTRNRRDPICYSPDLDRDRTVSAVLQIKLADDHRDATGAKNSLAAAEDMCDEDLEALHDAYRTRAEETFGTQADGRAARERQ